MNIFKNIRWPGGGDRDRVVFPGRRRRRGGGGAGCRGPVRLPDRRARHVAHDRDRRVPAADGATAANGVRGQRSRSRVAADRGRGRTRSAAPGDLSGRHGVCAGSRSGRRKAERLGVRPSRDRATRRDHRGPRSPGTGPNRQCATADVGPDRDGQGRGGFPAAVRGNSFPVSRSGFVPERQSGGADRSAGLAGHRVPARAQDRRAGRSGLAPHAAHRVQHRPSGRRQLLRSGQQPLPPRRRSLRRPYLGTRRAGGTIPRIASGVFRAGRRPAVAGRSRPVLHRESRRCAN
jgi:hypothetical protein